MSSSELHTLQKSLTAAGGHLVNVRDLGQSHLLEKRKDLPAHIGSPVIPQ
jgi:hypothetical protein